MSGKSIYITEFDLQRLVQLLGDTRDSESSPYLDALRTELERAKVVAPREIPADVITMNSTVTLVDVGSSDEDVFTLVFPKDADVEEGKISIMAPLGTAMLGYRVGDEFEWDVPMGRRRWRVGKIIYQPEAAGDYHL